MKSDIKYIIKKIIIGVGIAVGVMCVKSLPVFAEELQNYYIFYDEDFFNSGSYVFSLKPTQHTNSSIIDSFIVYDNYKVNLTMDNNFNYNGYYYLLYNETKNQYIMQYFASKEKLDFNYTYGLVYSQLSSGTPFQITLGSLKVFYNSDFKSITAPIDLNNYTNNVDYKTLNYSVLGESIYYGYTISKNSDNSLSIKRNSDRVNENEWKIVSTNIKSNIYKQLNQKVYNFYTYDTTPPIPTGYEKIDMKDKYAVVFYSKDVRKLEKKCTNYEDIYNTDEEGNVTIEQKCTEESYYLNFYRKGKFNIKISDIENMNYVDSIVTGASDTELVDETFIINKNEFKNSIIFYNNEQNPITDGEGNVTLKDYGGVGEIYFDPTIYGYFIIDNPDSEINEDINYIDENGNEKTTHVDTLPKQDASYDFNIDFDEESINKFDVKSGFLSFIKMINDGVGFFKKYIGNFMKGVPEFVYYFIIFVPILSIIVAVIKIVNR